MIRETQKSYVIVPKSHITNEMINCSTSKKNEHFKCNKHKSKVILKFSGPIPSCFIHEKIYSSKDILEELNKKEWIEGHTMKWIFLQHLMSFAIRMLMG